MFFKHFYDTDLAQGSYLIGCQASGEAIVVDPRRDVRVYLDEAAAQGLRIVAVTETHIHADYLSGSRELAQAAGARLYLSDEGASTEGASTEGDGRRRRTGATASTTSACAMATPSASATSRSKRCTPPGTPPSTCPSW